MALTAIVSAGSIRFRANWWLAMLLSAAVLAGCSSSGGPEGARGATARDRDAGIPLASEFDLTSYRGKVLVLNFWATWCGPCRIEIPALVKLRQSFSPEEVAIVGISTGERGSVQHVQQLLKSFAADFSINYDLFFDSDRVLYDTWSKRESLFGAVPATLVFDANGELRGKHLGVPRNRHTRMFVPFEVLGEEIQGLLDES